MATSQYIPGVCNIGEKEIEARKRIGWISLVVTLVLWAVLDYLKISPYWKILVFIPASMSATGFIQGFSQFCAGFGLKGVFNFSDELSKTDSVAQAEFREQDRKKAQMIFGQSVLVGVLVALIAFYI